MINTLERHPRLLVLFAAAVGLLALGAASKPVAAADSTTLGALTIEHPWARATDAMAKTGAIYFLLKNAGAEPDRLVSVSTPIAESAQLHTNVMKDGMIHMEPVDGIDIPAHGSAELKPGGFHVMLMGPKQQLKPGQHVELKLTFAKAGDITIRVPVLRQAGAGTMPMEHGKMEHGDMSGMKP